MTLNSRNSPLLPRPFTLPFAVIPAGLHGTVVAAVLNRVFAGPLQAAELEFLQGRTVCVRVTDMRLQFSLASGGGAFRAARRESVPDLTISGALHAFLLLVARREDADTLFFQRRLRLAGDTELGLAVKNFLDGMDVDSLWLPRQLNRLARQSLPLYERTFSRG